MNLEMPPWSRYLLCGIAFAWPLHVYNYVPYLDGTATGILITALIVMWALKIRRNPVRIPIEFWAPLFGIVVFAILARHDFSYILAGMTFVATTQFVRNALWTENVMWCSALTIGLLALLNAASHTLGLLPTSYSLESGLTMMGSYTVSEGIYMLMLGMLWGFYIAFFSKLPNAQRSSAIFIGFICLAVLAGKLFVLRGNSYDWSHSFISIELSYINTAVLLLIWLATRITAKLMVTREEGTNLNLVLVLTIALTLGFWCLFPPEIRLYHAFIFGIAAGYALPDRVQSAEVVRPNLVCIGLVFLLGMNVFIAFPLHEQDNRNITVAATNDFEQEDYGLLQQRMSCLATIYPNQQSRVFLWKARTSIRQGNLDKASKEFEYAVGRWAANGKDDTLQAHIELVLLEMRDNAARLPEDTVSFAYERALTAIGENESALLLLKLKLEEGTGLLPSEFSVDAKAYIYGALLGDVSLYDEMRHWDILNETGRSTSWNRILEQSKPELVKPGSMLYFIDRTPNEITFYSAIDSSFKQDSTHVPPIWRKTPEQVSAESHLSVRVTRNDDGADEFAIVSPVDSDSIPVKFALRDGSIHDIRLDGSAHDSVPYEPNLFYHPWAQILQILK